MIRESLLAKYAETSSVMKVSIKVDSEVVKFNLADELRLDDENITDEAIQHTSLYSFLTMVLTRLESRVRTLENKRKHLYGKLYIKYKTTKAATGSRAPGDDLVKSYIEVNDEYQLLVKKLAKTEDDKNLILRCVRAFETRKDLMQTISANLRKETH